MTRQITYLFIFCLPLIRTKVPWNRDFILIFHCCINYFIAVPGTRSGIEQQHTRWMNWWLNELPAWGETVDSSYMPYEPVVMALEPDLTKDQSASPDGSLQEQRVILITDTWFVTQQIRISELVALRDHSTTHKFMALISPKPQTVPQPRECPL